MEQIEEVEVENRAQFERDFRPLARPLVMRGIARHWPVVEAGRRDWRAALSYVAERDSGQPTDIMIAPPQEKGRFFYSADMQGFNFQRDRGTIANLAAHLVTLAEEAAPIAIYAGAAAIEGHAPAFAADHPFPLAEGQRDVTARIWMGNATQVATHFDLSDNFAVVALGKRRFTLFPPEATRDLYVGPLNHTLAGQPVSMVDPLNPDHVRYPRYAEAEKLAVSAELEPGDAIYIPTLWWHHVEATAPANILVNYWHNDVARGGGFLALVHAMLAIREMPQGQKDGWRAWFEHFVFAEDAAEAAAHLPDAGKGINGPSTPQRDEMMRRFILQVLSGQ